MTEEGSRKHVARVRPWIKSNSQGKAQSSSAFAITNWAFGGILNYLSDFRRVKWSIHFWLDEREISPNHVG